MFDSNKVSLNQTDICLNQISFSLESNKLYLLPYINALISLFWRNIYLIWTNIYLSHRYFLWIKQMLFNSNKSFVWIKKNLLNKLFSFIKSNICFSVYLSFWNCNWFILIQASNYIFYHTLQIPYNEISCNKAFLLRARHSSP